MRQRQAHRARLGPLVRYDNNVQVRLLASTVAPMQASKIDRFLAAEGDLQPVLAKAREIDALSKLCCQLLPPELARIAQVANYKDGRLVLLAANGAAAAKLKLLSVGLCESLSRTGRQVNSVSIRVQPAASSARQTAPKQARMSVAALAELAALHRSLRDSPVRKALKSLLDRHGATLSPRDARKPPRPGKATPGKGRT